MRPFCLSWLPLLDDFRNWALSTTETGIFKAHLEAELFVRVGTIVNRSS